MFTQTELRDALLHSAARADTVDEPTVLEPAICTSAEPEPRRAWRRRASLLPSVAASLILVLAVGAVTLRQHHGTSAVAGADPSAGTTTSVASSSVPPTVHARSPHHTSADIGDVVDAVQTSGRPAFEYDLARSGAEVVTRDLGPRTYVQVEVIRPKSGFDPNRIPRDHPVRISGTTGYYGLVRIDPLDGSYSDKYSPAWIVAFPSSGGTWIVAELDHAPGPNATYESVPDPSRIVAAYADLQLNYTTGTTRVPFRVGYLPSGMAVDSLSVNPLTGGTQVTATLVKGARSIQIDSYPAGLKNTSTIQCIPSRGPCPATASRTATIAGSLVRSPVGGMKVVVTGDGYGVSVVRRVLASLTLAPSETDQSGWWTVPDSLG